MGPEGSFSEEASRNHFGSTGELVAFPDIGGAISAVENNLVDAAVVPIENSIEGAISVTVDDLIHSRRPPRIVAEINLAVRQHLVGRPGTTLSEIQRLVAQPAALSQSRRWLEEHLPQVQVLPALSTSAAVASLVHSNAIAAIGSDRAARLYGMEVIATDIQDSDDNVTRFVVLGATTPEPTGRDKTSICCSIAEDRPGSLVAILMEFAARTINLTKIESRPTRGGLGKYYFLIDMLGHQADPMVAAALLGVQKTSQEFRILGSYPMAAPATRA